MITVGIAGLGKWGQILVSSIQGISDKIQVSAGVTGRQDRARAFCDAHGIELRKKLDDLLIDPALDGVILATPHSQHADQVVAAALAGKHIFIEKPFTLSRADANRAVSAVRDAGVVMALGHNRRFHPAIRRIKQLIEQGALGRLLHVEGSFSSNGGFRYTSDHWRAGETESPAGGMTGLGIHLIDAMIMMLGPIVEARALSERQVLDIDLDDTTTMLFRFHGGQTGYLGTFTATAPFWRFQIYGTKGWIEMWRYERLTIARLGQEVEVIELPPFDMERAELEAFATAVKGGPAYPLSLDEAVQGVAALEAVILSSQENGRPVSVEP